MTALSRDQPRVRLECAAAAGGLETLLRDAIELLARAGRIRPAGDDGFADVLHTVGEVPTGRGAHAAHRVHTVDRVPLRRGRSAAAPRWAHRQRRLAFGAASWLVHGRTAAQVLVASGVVPANLVHGLPLVAPPALMTGGGERPALRERLGARPGVGLVAAGEPGVPGQEVAGWVEAIEESRRPDVLVVRAAGLPLGELLAAADLFVAAEVGLAACNPAVAAVAAGVPVIATATDSAAELVRFGHNGFVVPQDPGAIAAAVRACVEGALPGRDARAPHGGDVSPARQLAGELLGVYRRALATPRPLAAGVAP